MRQLDIDKLCPDDFDIAQSAKVVWSMCLQAICRVSLSESLGDMITISEDFVHDKRTSIMLSGCHTAV
jgi:hypothetical protein